MPYLIFLGVLTVMLGVIAVILVGNKLESIKSKKDSDERDRIYKERQDAEAKERAEIPSNMIFDVPKEKIDEYYKMYGEYQLPTNNLFQRYQFWSMVQKMIPALENDVKIVNWLKDPTHTIWHDCNHNELMKPYIVVHFGKRERRDR